MYASSNAAFPTCRMWVLAPSRDSASCISLELLYKYCNTSCNTYPEKRKRDPQVEETIRFYEHVLEAEMNVHLYHSVEVSEPHSLGLVLQRRVSWLALGIAWVSM